MCAKRFISLSGFSSPVLSPARLSAILLVSLLLLVLTPRMSYAQSKLNSSPINTTPTLSQLKEISNQLVTRLTARIAESEKLSAELVALKDQAEKLQTDLSETSASLEASQAALNKLQSDFDAYKIQQDKNISAIEKERDAALIKAKIGSIGLKVSIGVIAIGGGYELGRYFKIW